MRRRIVGAALALMLVAPLGLAEGVVLFLGDSIGAGYRIPRGQGWVEVTSAVLEERESPWKIVNASVTGETAKGGSRRLSSLLRKHKPSVVILELGGNDALRGVPPIHVRMDLKAMIKRVQKAGAQAVVIGTTLPTNFGRIYTQEFEKMYADVARKNGAKHMSIVGTEAGRSTRFLQSDRIHPNRAAQPLLAKALEEFLVPVLEELEEEE